MSADTLIFITGNRNPRPFIDELNKIAPDIPIATYPDIPDKNKVVGALLWNHPHGVLTQFPNLKWISSIGAGVDHIFTDPDLPKNLLITRIVDDILTRDMSRYVVSCVLNAKKRIFEYKTQQEKSIWKPLPELAFEQVGILGAGALGANAAIKLTQLGFEVATFSNSKKDIEGVESYFGADRFEAFLNRSELLVNLLPLTAHTKHILNKDLFVKLPKGAIVVNAARGGHLAEEDLISALDAGQVSYAFLDVFEKEPLPQEHPFWNRKDIFISPHVASVTNPANAAKVIADNFKLLQQNKPLNFRVEYES